MKNSALIIFTFVSFTTYANAQSNNLEELESAYSSCLVSLLEKEKKKDKEHRRLKSIEKACASEMAAFYKAIGPEAVSQIPFKEKMLEELNK
jgi:hypothetical protein